MSIWQGFFSATIFLEEARYSNTNPGIAKRIRKYSLRKYNDQVLKGIYTLDIIRFNFTHENLNGNLNYMQTI